MQPYLRYAVRGLTKRPWRSFFIIFMMIISVMLMSGTTIAINDIPSMVEATVEEANMADFSLNLKAAPKLIVEQICEDKELIQEYEVRLVFKSIAYTVKGWPESTEILLIGVEAPVRLNRVTMISGRLFEENEDVIIVEHDYGENVFGKSVLVETPTENVTLEVVGTCRAVWMPRWSGSSTAYALIPIGVLQRILNAKNLVNQVLVKIREGYDLIDSMKKMSEEFEPYGVVSKSIEGKVVPFVETQSYYNYLVRLFSLIGFSLFAVSLTLMYSSLSLMVTQEFREIGTLKALGATRRSIIITYALRSILLGLVGSSMGALSGVIVARALMTGFAYASLTFEGAAYVARSLAEILQENKEMLILHGSLGIGLSLLLVFPSALFASKISASQAIKSFPGLPAMSGSSKPRLGHGPLFLKYALRSLTRRKGREVAIVIVIAISVAVNSTLIAASESQQAILNETSKALNFDFFICLNRRFNSTLLEKDLKPFVGNITSSEFGYYTQVKAAGYTFFVIGTPINATYFSYSLVEGRRFKESEDGVILSENLARTLNMRANDILTFSNERISLDVTVVGVRRDPVFNVPIVPLYTAQKLEGSEGRVNAIVIKAKEGVNLDRLIQDVRRNIPGYLWHIKKPGVIDIVSDVLTKTFQSTAAVMIVFTWVTSLLLIFSIAGQDINEERVVITILRALGMSKEKCILMIVFKLLILGLLAAFFCILFTPLILQIFSEFLSRNMIFSAPIGLSTGVLLSSALFILMTTLPSGLALGIYATSVKIATALRYE